MQEWTDRHDMARADISGVDNSAPCIARVDFAGVDKSAFSTARCGKGAFD